MAAQGVPRRTVKKVAIVQSTYMAWKGYFDLIDSVDEFILYADMQFTRRDWRNRKLIKTPGALQWLTIPTATKGRYLHKICETAVSDAGWGEVHWTLSHNYAKAPFVPMYRQIFELLYREAEPLLSQVNFRFILAICGILGITTGISWSIDYRPLKEGKTKRLVDLCTRAGGTHPQQWGRFEHGVAALDLLFNVGPQAAAS